MSSYEEPLLQRIYYSVMGPSILIGTAMFYAFHALLEAPFLVFTNFEVFRHKAFAKFWSAKGKEFSQEFPGRDLIQEASGTVLDLGPGAGYLIKLMDANKVTAVYGIEPAIDLHSELSTYIEAAGLGGKYKALVAGAEPESLLPALAKTGLLDDGSEGIFDTILCIRVLCGIRQKDTIPTLYRLLKPGGRMIISEHVTSPWPDQGEILGFVMQKFFTLIGWKFWVGCSMNQDTLSALKEAGGRNGWASFDLKYDGVWHPVPFISGILVKS